MKRTTLGFALGMLALAAPAFAGGSARYNDERAARDTVRVYPRYVDQNEADEYRVLTGSHIKQRVKKRNIIAAGARQNVLIIDRNEMQRNGNGTMVDVLRHYPGISITGH